VFQFNGDLEISKSWMNRALILQSFQAELKIIGDSASQDVQLLKKALAQFKEGETEFYAGLGGTTFRFLAFRVSRKPGNYLIRADRKLLERPQTEIIEILKQLGVEAQLNQDGLLIRSGGWKKPMSPIQVGTQESSQFLSALALSALDLDFHFQLALTQKITSESYFKMTLELLKQVGVTFGQAHQSVRPMDLFGEVDVSSAFSLMAAAVLGGQAQIQNWNSESLQPDIRFLNFFRDMKINFSVADSKFEISKQVDFQSIRADLSSCPDLFPVLSVLCAFAQGESILFNAPQLKFKESNRIEKTFELLSKCGFQVQKTDDGMIIHGQPDKSYKAKDLILFDPAHDHRMAMAAGLLKIKGFPIQISDMTVVNKSYPQFFQHIGLDL
jgi:3-phosphoshikimate 1-carboxyvinyltransferase